LPELQPHKIHKKLPTLAEASDPQRMSVILADVLQRKASTPLRIHDVRIETVRQRKRRCVLRYRVRIEQDGQERTLGLYGKVYRFARGEPVWQLMEALAQSGFHARSPDRISIPGVTAYLPGLSLLLQQEVGGRTVTQHLPTPLAETAIRRMGATVAKLHNTRLDLGAPYTLNDYLKRCHPPHEVLCERIPELRASVEHLVDEAGRRIDSYTNILPTLVHGDLHLAQVLVDTDRTWMIDFDACCIADPAADLGNVLVFIRNKRRTIHNVEALTDAFLDEYFKTRPHDVLSRVPTFEALTFLRRACKRVRLEEKGWLRKARRCVDAGVRRLEAVSA
jgi:tRNA A-37 threonylcarbamoyl transferase component Bud32